MEHDIIIIGAGPAGTSTALHLAQLAPDLARRTLILERARHPRPKLCGGGILQDGEFILRRLGLDLTQVPHVDVHEARFQFEGRGFGIRRQPVSFRVLQRELFDAWLFDAACARGVVAQQETRVLQVRPVEDAVEVDTDRGMYRARVVVAADGVNSVARRAVVGREPGRHLARLLELYIPPDQADRDYACFDCAIIGNGVQGYVWDFPMLIDGQPARNRGIYDSRISPDQRPARLKSPLRAALAQDGVALDDYPLQSHPIRCFDPASVLAAPRVLLVGDAAGIDPVFGEGISFSLGYGELAARELRDAFARDDFSFTGYRRRILSHPMGQCLMRRRRMARLLYGIRDLRIQRLLWWRVGVFMRWYIENFLIDWAK